MTTPAQAEIRIVGVSRLASFIGGMFAREARFARLGVSGEVTNLRALPNGNVYFDLKDRDALLNCVAFAEAAASFPPFANGEEVVAIGSVTTFAKASRYQLRVLEVRPAGNLGVLHQRYEALKKRLSEEGLFAAERKRALPRFPFRIALVTSRNAEGARDFLTQAHARAPHIEVVVVETPVQGEAAAPEIARAIARASALPVEMIVLARGGGSYEDLFVFSDERVVRALAAAGHPTVSAIGHEADAPLTDFVADHRAPTPSAAAQMLLPRRDDLLRMLAEHRRVLFRDAGRLVADRRQRLDAGTRRLTVAARDRLRERTDRLRALERRLQRAEPASRLAARRERLAALAERLSRSGQAVVPARAARLARASGLLGPAAARLVERKKAAFGAVVRVMHGLDPDMILQRGYAIVTTTEGRPLKDADGVKPGDRITARLARGSIAARVERDGTDGGRQINLF